MTDLEKQLTALIRDEVPDKYKSIDAAVLKVAQRAHALGVSQEREACAEVARQISIRQIPHGEFGKSDGAYDVRMAIEARAQQNSGSRPTCTSCGASEGDRHFMGCQRPRETLSADTCPLCKRSKQSFTHTDCPDPDEWRRKPVETGAIVDAIYTAAWGVDRVEPSPREFLKRVADALEQGARK